jgi:hypothetical protein
VKKDQLPISYTESLRAPSVLSNNDLHSKAHLVHDVELVCCHVGKHRTLSPRLSLSHGLEESIVSRPAVKVETRHGHCALYFPRLPRSNHTIIQSSYIVPTEHHPLRPISHAALLLLRSVPSQPLGKLPFGLVLLARRDVDPVIGDGSDLILPTRTQDHTHQPTKAHQRPLHRNPPCSYSSHLGRTKPSCKYPKQPRLLHGITIPLALHPIDLLPVAFRRLHGAKVEQNERRTRWPRWGLGRSFPGGRRIRGSCDTHAGVTSASQSSTSTGAPPALTSCHP